MEFGDKVQLKEKYMSYEGKPIEAFHTQFNKWTSSSIGDSEMIVIGCEYDTVRIERIIEGGIYGNVSELLPECVLELVEGKT